MVRPADRLAIALTVADLPLRGTFTLIRGEIVGFYPYLFMNPAEHGYRRVAANLVVSAATFVAFRFGA